MATESGGEGNPADEGEATKPARLILKQEIDSGAEQLDRPAIGLLLSAVSAGLDVGFGPFLVATLLALDPVPSVGGHLVSALAYAVGFVIVILGRSELFTEHTTLAVLPLLSGDKSVADVARLWALVYIGNLAGVTIFAGLSVPLGKGLGLFTDSDLSHLGTMMTASTATVILGSGIAAGWLMGLVSWLVTAARETMSQIMIIVLVAGSISMLHLHHSIAGSVEVLMGVFGGGIPIALFWRFLALATIGNAIGGVVLVAGLKYGHIVNPGPSHGKSKTSPRKTRVRAG